MSRATERKAKQGKKRWTGRKILIFVALVSTVQIYTFSHYNRILSNPISVTKIPATSTKPIGVDTQKEISDLTKQYPVSAASDDNQSFAYVDNQNVLHLKDLVHGTELATVTNTYPVQFLEWIRDDMVFVGEQKEPGVLVLKTVDASTGTPRVLNTFTGLYANDKFKKIAYSALTNDVYILIGADASSMVYHYDTMSNLSRVYLGGRFVKNIEVTQTGNQLYFEDYASGTFNVLCKSQGVVHLVSRNSALVTVQDNTLYYGSVNANGLVTAVYKYDNTSGNGVLVSNLQTPAMANQIEVSSDGQIHIKSSST